MQARVQNQFGKNLNKKEVFDVNQRSIAKSGGSWKRITGKSFRSGLASELEKLIR
jgi:hypothetical protein